MWRRLLPDRFLLILIATVVLASRFPPGPSVLAVAGWISNAAIVLLFFVHGARLPRAAVLDGVRRWRLQLAILLFGYALMPLVGWGASHVVAGWFAPGLVLGIAFLTVLPTTVQSSIAFSSIGGGNIAASVIAAALSNLLGVVLVPVLLVVIAQAAPVAIGLGGIGKVGLLLLLPFTLGQIAGGWIQPWIARNQRIVGPFDKLTVVLAVYVAFAEAAIDGLWSRIGWDELALLGGVVLALLAFAFSAAWWLGGLLRLNHADRVTLLFSGGHKSLATGAPMARILLPPALAGAAILPLMLYHQFQLMLSAVVAGRLARLKDRVP